MFFSSIEADWWYAWSISIEDMWDPRIKVRVIRNCKKHCSHAIELCMTLKMCPSRSSAKTSLALYSSGLSSLCVRVRAIRAGKMFVSWPSSEQITMRNVPQSIRLRSSFLLVSSITPLLWSSGCVVSVKISMVRFAGYRAGRDSKSEEQSFELCEVPTRFEYMGLLRVIPVEN